MILLIFFVVTVFFYKAMPLVLEYGSVTNIAVFMGASLNVVIGAGMVAVIMRFAMLRRLEVGGYVEGRPRFIRLKFIASFMAATLAATAGMWLTVFAFANGFYDDVWRYRLDDELVLTFVWSSPMIVFLLSSYARAKKMFE
jgi:hypothetical protein